MVRKIKNKGGRPKHVPSEAERSLVRIFVAAGLTNVEIARYMKMDRKTLVRHYNDDLETGWIEAVGDAAKAIIEEMRDQNSDKRLDAAKFFLTRRGKGLWSDTKNVEISGPGGGAIPIAPIDLDALDFEELELLDSILAPALIEGKVIEHDPEEDDEEEYDVEALDT